MSLAEEFQQQYSFRDWEQVYRDLPLEPGQLVLDLGCAVGDQAAALVGRGARVLGIDADADLLAVARAKQLPHADFVEADLSSWTDPSLRADGLWSTFTAAYFASFGPVLERWLAALRPGAWVMLVEVDDLFGHFAPGALVRQAVLRFYDQASREGRYDFLMGRKLKSIAVGVGLEGARGIDLPDRELAFDGAAARDVLTAWSQRLDRMKGLQLFLGAEWPSFRRELLAALAAPDHRSSARVVSILARKPSAHEVAMTPETPSRAAGSG